MKWLLGSLLVVSCAAHAITADAYLVQELDGTVLLSRNADAVRPIASITKLFIAQASEKLDQNELITITKDDLFQGRMRSSPLRRDQAYTRRQLTELALVSSDNVAAIALGRTVPYSTTSLATLVEPSGLSPSNSSTARQLGQAARDIYNTELAEITTHPRTEVGDRRSTNPLLTKEGWSFYLSKTGFINESGGCLVVITQISQKIVTVVILGARNTRERWMDLIELRRELGDHDFYVPVKVTQVKLRPRHRRVTR